jgi:hypothetical protein
MIDTQLSDILAGGIGIISLNPRLVDNAMDRNMKAILQLNGFQFDTDYTKISRLSAMNLLRAILGKYSSILIPLLVILF